MIHPLLKRLLQNGWDLRFPGLAFVSGWLISKKLISTGKVCYTPKLDYYTYNSLLYERIKSVSRNPRKKPFLGALSWVSGA
jgi:hypothetical protein